MEQLESNAVHHAQHTHLPFDQSRTAMLQCHMQAAMRPTVMLVQLNQFRPPMPKGCHRGDSDRWDKSQISILASSIDQEFKALPLLQHLLLGNEADSDLIVNVLDGQRQQVSTAAVSGANIGNDLGSMMQSLVTLSVGDREENTLSPLNKHDEECLEKQVVAVLRRLWLAVTFFCEQQKRLITAYAAHVSAIDPPSQDHHEQSTIS